MAEITLKARVAEEIELPVVLTDLGDAIDRQIRLFLNGENDGASCFEDFMAMPSTSRHRRD